MEIGAVFEGEVIVYEVEIEGRGGNSIHDEYYYTEEDAVMASAIDGPNNSPRPITAWKFSDGTYMKPSGISMRPAPTEEEKAKILEELTPAQKILLGRK